jgi:hypothetical protein
MALGGGFLAILAMPPIGILKLILIVASKGEFKNSE